MSSPTTHLWLTWSTQLEGLGADPRAAVDDAWSRLHRESALDTPVPLHLLHVEIYGPPAIARQLVTELRSGADLNWEESLARALGSSL